MAGKPYVHCNRCDELAAGSAELMQKLAWSKETYDAIAAELSTLQHATRGQTFQTPNEKDARIGALEAALRKIEGNAGEIDLTACAQIAREALGSEAETSAQRLRACWNCDLSLDLDERPERCPDCNSKDPCGNPYPFTCGGCAGETDGHALHCPRRNEVRPTETGSES